MADFYNPSDLTTEDLLKRVKVSNQTRDFIRSSTGTAVCEKAIASIIKLLALFKRLLPKDGGAPKKRS
jgi:hypothetical protein